MSEPIISKKCPKCKQTKSLTEFCRNRSKKSGVATECKTCHIINVTNYRKTEKGKTSQKRYRQTDKGKAARKRYKQSEKYRVTQRASDKRYLIRCPERCKARKAVNNAIQDGKLLKPNTLQCHYYLQNPDCEKQAKQYHHHLGYESKHRLDVVPLCMDCHRKAS